MLGAVGKAATLVEARKRAYEHIQQTSFEGITYRRDIAEKSLGKVRADG